ncbi:MAG: hypothetical protein IT478_03710 [Xanthomonadales bacterium]|nr:hypothetical protein [Xanthomonadales bacterium]
MNKTKKHSLALLLGMLASGADAAQWTQSTDISSPASDDQSAHPVIVTGPHGFSVGTAFAIDREGRRVGIYDLPEQYGVRGKSLYSSRRGKLWDNADYNAYDLRADGAGNLWVSKYSDFFSGLGSVDRLARDGATRSVFAFSPDREAPPSAPLVDRDGALIAECLSFDGASGGSVKRIDARGRTLARWDTGSCATSVVDDLAGGAWVGVRDPLDGGGRATHLLANGDQWPQDQTIAGARPLQATREGGVVTARGQEIEYRAANGAVRFRLGVVTPSALRTYDHGFWLETPGLLSLIHIDSSGVRTVVPLAHGMHSLDVLDNGLALVQSSAGLALYSPNGQQLADEDTLPLGPANASVLAFDGVLVQGDRNQLRVLAEHGAPSSITLQLPVLYDRIDGVRAGMARICVMQTQVFTLSNGSRTDCFDRRSGALLTSVEQNAGFASLPRGRILGVDGDLLVQFAGDVFEYDAAGTLRFTLPAAGFAAADSRFGIATLTGAEIVLNDLAGQARSRISIAANIELERARWSDDGSLLLSGFSNDEGHLFRLAANGTLVGQHRFANDQRISDAIDTGSSVLVATRADEGRAAPQVHALSRDLGSVLHSEPAPGLDIRFWKSNHSGAWLTGTSPGSVSLLRVDAGGTISQRHALALDHGTVLHVAGDGLLQATDSDAATDRYWLRLYQPTTPAFAGPVAQTALSGSWYSPSSTGQGLIVDLLNQGSHLFAAWHTYAAEGGNRLEKQQWLSVQGNVGLERGSITLPIYRNGGGRFDAAGETGAEPVGSAELVFTDCDHMEFWYRIGDESGALPLQRLTPRTSACETGSGVSPAQDAAPVIELSGAWYDPSRSGQGLAVSASGTRFNQFLAGWFTYDTEAGVDDESAQHWFTLQGANPSGYGVAVAAQIYRTIGGSRAGEPTRNTHAVGEATLTVHDCAHATLSYRFDDSVVAGSFANLQRSVTLQRLGACPD